MRKLRNLVILSSVAFLLIGIFLNSTYFNVRKDEVYSQLKEKYQSASSDIITNEENVIESTKEEIDEKDMENVEEEKVETPKAVEKKTTEQYVWDYLRNNGYTEIQTAAIIGNLYQESGLNPSRIESNGEGIGLVQWSFGRKEQLKKYASSKGKDWTDLDCQLEFLIKELNSSQFYTSHKNIFNNPYSINEATEAFCWGFERPNSDYANIANRKDKAWASYYRNTGR